MTTPLPRPAAPPPLRRVSGVLGLLASGLVLAAALLVSAASPGSAPVTVLALIAALFPLPVAAVTLRPRAPGPVTAADLITMLRLLGAGALAAAAVLVLSGDLPERSWTLAVLAGLTLASDVLDGPVARAAGTAGPIGARLDMEADAALNLVLSLLAATVVGPWALAFGLMRYAFVAAASVRPALRRPLVFSQLRRRIGGFQGIALLTAVAPAIPVQVSTAVLVLALGLLVVSFGRDVIALERLERRERRADRAG